MATPKPQCPNSGPKTAKDPETHGHLRYTTCPDCGGYLAILSSGRFRAHKMVFKPGDPRIAENNAK